MRKKRGKKREEKKEVKKGLSTVLVMLILILVSISAVSIVWVVVKNVLQSESEHVSIGQFVLNAQIMNVYFDNNSNDVNLTVKRNQGEGEFDTLRFVFYDGQSYEIVTQAVSLDELEERQFSIHLNDLTVSHLASISMVPILNQNGKEDIGNTLDEYTVREETNLSFTTSWGDLVLWLKCDDDLSDSRAIDSSRYNHSGNCSGTTCPSYLPTGGPDGSGAYDFNGIDDQLKVFDTGDVLDLNASGTISVWVWVNEIPASTYTALAIKRFGDYSRPYNLYLNPAEMVYFTLGNSTTLNSNSDSVTYSTSLKDGSWHHVVGVWNYTNLSLYVDGIKRNEKARTVGDLEINNEALWIGRRTGYFNGTIDALRIYNRSLSLSEIQNLYNNKI